MSNTADINGASTNLCPRCGAAFHCGVNDAVPCACFGVTLSPATRADLRQRYTTCLCLNCLQVLATQPADAAGA